MVELQSNKINTGIQMPFYWSMSSDGYGSPFESWINLHQNKLWCESRKRDEGFTTFNIPNIEQGLVRPLPSRPGSAVVQAL